MALSCHLTMGLLCQEMRNEGCVEGELRVAEFPSFSVIRVPGKEEEVF